MPPSHPRIALTLKNLGDLSLASAAGGSGEALALYQRALSIEEASLDPDHPQPTRTRKSISKLTAAASGGTRDEAARSEEPADAKRRRSLGTGNEEDDKS